MYDAAAVEPPTGLIRRFEGPKPLFVQERAWEGLHVQMLRKVPGESIMQSLGHRIAISLTHQHRTLCQLDDGPVCEIDIPAGSVGFIPAGIVTRIVTKGAQVIYIHQAENVYRRAASGLADYDRIAFGLLAGQPDPLVLKAGQELVQAAHAARPGDQLLVDSLNMALAVWMIRRFLPNETAHRAAPVGLDGIRLKRVADYIEANLGADLTLQELASVGCLSPFHFSRAFKAAMGLPPYRYVQWRRIVRAQELLLGTDLPLAEVAVVCGFDSQSSLTTRFRREFGITPGKLRDRPD